jgi:hypothetical protein
MHTATTPHLHYPTLNILLYPHRVEQTYSEIHPHTRVIADSHEESTIRKKQNRRYLRTHNKIHTVLHFSTTPKPGTVQCTTFTPID